MKYKAIPDSSKLKKKLWEVFSLYTRLRYADWKDFDTCVTCGAYRHYKEMDAGHYIPKTAGLSIYFEEKNVHPQCDSCNRKRHGNLTNYALFLRKKYGEQILEELDWKRNHPVSITTLEYIRLIDLYKQKLVDLGKKSQQ